MSLETIVDRFSLSKEFEPLPSWIKFFLLLGESLSNLDSKHRYIVGISVPALNFIPLLIASGVNLKDLRIVSGHTELKDSEINMKNQEITPESIKERLNEEFKVKDNKGVWTNLRFKRKYESNGITFFSFLSKVGWNDKLVQVDVPLEEFDQRIQNSNYSADSLEVPPILEGIFERIDLREYISSGSFSSTGIIDVKTKIYDDASNEIFYKKADGTFVGGILSDICKLVGPKEKAFGSFTRLYSSYKIRGKKIDIKELAIFTHKAYEKIDAEIQTEKVRIILFDRSTYDYESLDNSKERFLSDVQSLNFQPYQNKELFNYIPHSVSLVAFRK